MTSKNGSRMWKPASSVPEYFPSRSTMKALCCGTTTAVLATTTSSRIARTTTTISIGVSIGIRVSPRPASSLGLHPERQAVHALDPGPLPSRQAGPLARPYIPRRAAQLRLPHPAGRQVLGQDRRLADERVHRLPRRL